MAKCYVKAYYDWIEQTAALSDAERGRLFISILEYARSGLLPDGSGRESLLFPVFKSIIDRDAETSANNAENGAKGGRGNKAKKANESEKSETKRIEANESEEKPTKDIRHKTKDEDKDKDKREEAIASKRKSAVRFIPPTIDEVEAYCQERGNGVDPERFVDFYASKGWRVGKEPMKDWKAAVRTWERRDNHNNGYAQNKPVATADRLAQMIRDGVFDD